jgi:hypothetical protein
MCGRSVVKIFVEYDAASSVAPAGDSDRYTESGRVTRRVDDVDSHNRFVSAHALRPNSYGIDTFLEHLFKTRSSFVFIM